MARFTEDGVVLSVKFDDGEARRQASKMGSDINKMLEQAFNIKGGKTVAQEFIKARAEFDRLSASLKELRSTGNDLQFTKSFSKLRSQFDSIMDEIDLVETKMRNLEEISPGGRPYGQAAKEYDKLGQKLNELRTQSDLVVERMEEMELAGSHLQASPQVEKLSNSLDKARSRLGLATQELKRFTTAAQSTGGKRNVFTDMLSGGVKLLGKGLKGIGSLGKKALDGLRQRAEKSAHGIRRLGLAFVGAYGTFALLRKAIQFAREGFNNLSKVSSTTRQNTQNLQASLLYLKNALGAVIAPIYNVIAPALSKMVDMFASAINTVAKFIGAITGKSTVYVAKKTFSGITDGASSAGSALGGASEKAEELKRQLMGFDQIEKLDDPTKDLGSSGSGGGSGGGGGTDYDSMFEEVSTERDGLFADFFEPFKKAWENKGKGVVDAFKNALEGTKEVTKAVGDSFWEVWTNGTGQKSLEHILGIVTGIFNTWGNLTKAFAEGWKFNDNGTKIIQNLWDTLNDVLGMFDRIANATADWAKNLDLTKVIGSFQNVTAAIEPLVKNITEGLASAYEEVLLPFGKWVIEDAAPVFLDVVAEAIEGINNVINIAKPGLKWLFDNFISPLAHFAGSAIVTVLTGVKNVLSDINDILSGEKSWKDWWEGLAPTEPIEIEARLKSEGFSTNGKDPFKDYMTKQGGHMDEFGNWVIDVKAQVSTEVYAVSEAAKKALELINPAISLPVKVAKISVDLEGSSQKIIDEINETGKPKTANIEAKLKTGLQVLQDVNKTDGEKKALLTALFSDTNSKSVVDATNDTAGTKKAIVASEYQNERTKDRFNAANSVDGIKKSIVASAYQNDKTKDRFNAANSVQGKKMATIQSQYANANVKPRFNAANDVAGKKMTTIKSEYYNDAAKQRIISANNVAGKKTVTIDSRVTGLTQKLKQFFGIKDAKGGAFYGGRWHGIPQYASGGWASHGTIFQAGEKGPEVVGHVGGRTEVLNASQLATAVASGVGNAFSRLTIRMPNVTPALQFLGSQQQAVAQQQEQNTQGVMNLLVQILTAIKDIDTDTYIDGDKITNTIVKNINRRTRLTGVSELIY